MRYFKNIVFGLLGALLLMPQLASAESTSCTAASCSTSARVDFQVTIPVFLSLRVGTDSATVDTVTFSPAAAVIGNSVAQSGAGGDLTRGAVTTAVQANGGNVTLSTTLTNAASGLISGANFIAWNEIDTTVAGTMAAPTLQNGGVTDVVYTATGGVVDIGGSWTYEYANTTIPGAGTYTGTATYTAAIP